MLRSTRVRGLAVVLAATLACGCDRHPPRHKQAQVVKLLPDAPPPPPRPEERRPEPRKEDQPQAQPQAEPKPAPQPEAQVLKSDEAAGQGPGSGIAAGPVSQDYAGGAIGAASSLQVGAINRLLVDSYAQATTRSLNDFLAREQSLRQADYRLMVNVWLQQDGRIQRAELVGSSGDAQLDAMLKDALMRYPGAASPPPERMPQPLRLRISNRMIG